LERNIGSAIFEKIYLLIDDGSLPDTSLEGCEIIRVSSRPTYYDWLSLTFEKLRKGSISVLSNTDIFFDESIKNLENIYDHNESAFVALTRTEYINDDLIQRHPDPHWSQDVWSIKVHGQLKVTSMQEFNIPLGKPRCDNKVAFLAAARGIKMFNPVNFIRAFHLHNSDRRDYHSNLDTTVLGACAWVYPCDSYIHSSDITVDVWMVPGNSLRPKLGTDYHIQINPSWTMLDSDNVPKPLDFQYDLPDSPDNSHRLQVLGLDEHWQYPAITEKHAFVKAHEYLAPLILKEEVVYFGFPWATLIDLLKHGQSEDPRRSYLLNKLSYYKHLLSGKQKVITVCQHIRLLEYSYLFSDVGITHLFWSHKVVDQDFVPGTPNVRLLPFPLYPVNYLDSLPAANDKPRYLYSFVGAEAKSFYLTNSRNLIAEHLNDDEHGLIEVRKDWHFNRIVYDHQIQGTSTSNSITEPLIDDDYSRVYLDSLTDSSFILCPSGSGPNSIRLWEAIASGRIPIVLSDTYDPPCDTDLWNLSTLIIEENEESIRTIPARLKTILSSNSVLSMQKHLALIREFHGPACFVGSILQYLLTDGRSVSSSVNNISDKLRISPESIQANPIFLEAVKQEFKQHPSNKEKLLRLAELTEATYNMLNRKHS